MTEKILISERCGDNVSTSPQYIRSLSTSTSSSSIEKSSFEELSSKNSNEMSQNDHISLLDDLWSLTDLSSANSEVDITEQIISKIPADHWSKYSCDNVKNRISSLFLNEFMSDVCFVCESSIKTSPEKIIFPAHKFILASASSVFYTMFYGSMAESNKNINISDIDSETFLEVLRYLYCDQIDVEDVACLLKLLYASKKYFLTNLFENTVKKLLEKLSSQNACFILEGALLFEISDLIDQVLEYVDAQTEKCLKSECTFDISVSTMCNILQRETLNAPEYVIYDAVERWCLAQFTTDLQEGSDNDNKDKNDNDSKSHPDSMKLSAEQRKMFENVRSLIRFPTMDLSEFANGPAQGNLLLPNAKNVPKLVYLTKPRAGLKTFYCSRFRSSAFRTNQWRYRGRCDSIQFTVSRRIFLTSIGLFGSSNGSHEYKVYIEIKHDNVIIHKEQTTFQSNGTSNVFSVPLCGSPVAINSNRIYTLSLTIQGSELTYFGQDGMSHVRVLPGLNFNFYASPESTNGTGVQGGQIAELHFYCPSLNSKCIK